MAPDADQALMLAFQRGDPSAFRSLYERNAPAMIAYCRQLTRDAARAEELAQDVFLKVHAARDRYRPTARFKTFLYRIASNHCLNELRRPEHALRARPGPAPTREGRGPDDAGPDLDAVASDAATPEEAATASALERAFAAVLDRLPEKQRAALLLCRFEGLSYEEIASVLDTTVPAVKSLVHRATVAAAEALAPFGPATEEAAS